MLTIIIPVLNEEKILKENGEYYHKLCEKAKVIFVDGGSTDETCAIIEKMRASLLRSQPSRAVQKNIGAQAAVSKYLIFLHVDTFIDLETLERMEKMLRDGFLVGCFQMRINHSGFMYRVYEWAVNYRAKHWGVLDGDLGFIIEKELFEHLGGFGRYQIMEDVILGRKLPKECRLKVFDETICVSSRRWEEQGFIRTFLRYVRAYIRLWMKKIPKEK